MKPGTLLLISQMLSLSLMAGEGSTSHLDALAKSGVRLLAEEGQPGQWLQLVSEQAFSEREFEIGPVRDVEAYLANRRYTSCWMEPVAGTDLATLPRETQFLLLRLRGSRYLAMVALLDGAFRCSLRGGSDGGLRLLAESGDRATVTNRVTGLYLEEGADPYALVASAAARLRARYHGAETRPERQVPDFARTLGWCSWNAFYTAVSREKLLMAMEQFRDGGVQPGFVVIDDGWFQSTNHALVAFAADTVKFPDGLGEAVRTLKTNYGLHQVLLWQAYNGYWRGLAPSLLKDVGGRMIQPSFPGWITEPAPKAVSGRMDTTARSFYPAVYRTPIGQPDIASFYDRFHERLKDAGVDGVKLDAMTWIESLGEGRGGRVAMMRELVQATARSEQRFFDRNVIWCSSCSSDCILLAPRSAVMRSSTDYFPDKPESHGHHLAINAHASLWMGEFVIPDWDMFQSGHRAGAFHAAARALSGGPVYVADELGKTDFALLRKLCFSDRTVPLCAEAARPAPDSLFLDPGKEERLFKIFNRNPAGNWVVGVFHCSYNTNALGALSGFAGPEDVHGIQGSAFAVYRHGERHIRRMGREAKLPLTLQPLGFEVLTVAPVDQGFAAIGLADKFNSGGCVVSVKHRAEGVEVGLRDGGEFLAWMDSPPKSVKVAGAPSTFEFDVETGTLRVRLQATAKIKVVIAR